MPEQPQLDPIAIEAAGQALWKRMSDPLERKVYAFTDAPSMMPYSNHARAAVSAYLAAALPEVTSVEELVTTRAGLALANTAFGEGLSAGIRACNASGPDRPFKKPVSPYSAPLLAMIKADSPEVKP
ncbi:hypothetical protein DFO58_3284 [Arthrobacter sp. AG1021]|uniref:hypothetical protein n=1 Tax=Arthrobacter sp. AG1021 TaxID=2183908 RepID=UPI000EAF9979|nr:hypothetical protein [Arthrobacter sp. AG1021]RKS16727.1 hypothetical protein DFO58_3284 [Arthrobacter sp. AG1021]